MQIRNQVPDHQNTTRLACIFTSPAAEDKITGQPFNDPNNGEFVRNYLAQQGLRPSNVMLGYLDQYHSNKAFNPGSDTAQISIKQLREDLLKFKPNCILIFGVAGQRIAGAAKYPLNNWRGSIFKCDTKGSPFYGFKCICTFESKTVMTFNYGALPLHKFDINKAIREAGIPDMSSILTRNFDLDLTPKEIISKLHDLPSQFTFDIEGGIPNPSPKVKPELRFPNAVTCLSIATSPTYAFNIPFQRFSVEETVEIILTLRKVFADPTKGKNLQNSMYDAFVLAWLFHIYTANINWDTMLSGFVLYPELPKALETQTSIYTNEPYYKADRKSEDLYTHWSYCCMDSCVTHEIMEKHKAMMNPSQHNYMQFNLELLPLILYMELRGMSFDTSKADYVIAQTRIQMEELQTRIQTRIGAPINLNSSQQLCTLLYKTLNFPKQHPKKTTGRGQDTTKLTSSIDAILNLSQKHDSPILHEILAWRKLEKIRSMVGVKTDRDGRLRCSYNSVGTETGRFTSKKSPTGNGANLQTVTKKLRPIISVGQSASRAHPEPRYFWQVDLAGADGWTVAAHCNRLGDPTMLQDYLAGIKPARVIGLMHLKGSEVSKLSREEVKQMSKIVGEGEHTALYFICKQVQHGSNYQLGHATMAQLIVKQSYKQLGSALRVPTQMCAALQDQYFARYKGVKDWQNWVTKQIKERGSLTAASGHTRIFLGRRNSSETVREALAQEPQHNTTYVTNRAAKNLWNDPENRYPDGSLIIEPLHQVHDALNGSFPVHLLDWALPKIRSYFDFTVTIAGQEIRIPFEGEYGNAWGHTIGQI